MNMNQRRTPTQQSCLRSLRSIPITHVIDVGVADKTESLLKAYPHAIHHLFEPHQQYKSSIHKNYRSVEYLLHPVRVGKSVRPDSYVVLKEHDSAFLKIDVDGAELAVFDSCSDLLGNVSVVMIEAYRKRFCSIAESVAKCGFHLYDVVDLLYHSNHLHQCDLVFVSNKWYDTVFPPHSRSNLYRVF